LLVCRLDGRRIRRVSGSVAIWKYEEGLELTVLIVVELLQESQQAILVPPQDRLDSLWLLWVRDEDLYHQRGNEGQ